MSHPGHGLLIIVYSVVETSALLTQSAVLLPFVTSQRVGTGRYSHYLFDISKWHQLPSHPFLWITRVAANTSHSILCTQIPRSAWFQAVGNQEECAIVAIPPLSPLTSVSVLCQSLTTYHWSRANTAGRWCGVAGAFLETEPIFLVSAPLDTTSFTSLILRGQKLV